MIDFIKKLFGRKAIAQEANSNTNSNINQAARDINNNYHLSVPTSNEPINPPFYISKKGKDIEPIELLTTRASKEQCFNPYFYLNRPEVDDVLLKRLANFKSAIIIGKPLAGKTRAIFQLAQNELADVPFFIPTDVFSVENTIEMPISVMIRKNILSNTSKKP
jgi:hypothetical protein